MPFLLPLAPGSVLIGTMFRLIAEPEAARVAKAAGLDFVMLDMEHGQYGMEDLARIATVARGIGLGIMVRVPELARGHVSRALDCGAQGVMVPMIDSVEQAKLLAKWAKYPPQGGRGLSSAGGHCDFVKGPDVVADLADANRTTLAIAQIETVGGVESIDAIAQVDGIDVLLIGPNDLAVSLGVPGQLMHPKVDAAIERVAVAAEKHGRIFAMHGPADMLERWAGRGMRILMNGLDIDALGAGLRDLADHARTIARR